MIKNAHIFWLLVFLPKLVFSQEFKPSDFNGTLYFIDEKSVNFTYLSDSNGRTQIPFLRKITSEQRSSSMHQPEFIQLQWVDRIEFLGVSKEEKTDMVDSKLNSGLQKVKITYKENPMSYPDTVFLIITKFKWKNDENNGFSEIREASCNWLDSIIIHLREDKK